jgi:hypothetical protein
MKASSMSNEDAILNRLGGIETSIDALSRSLILLTETLGTHSEMLGLILEACSADPGESELTGVLERVANAIEGQNDRLTTIARTLEHIGPSIEGAVVRGVHRAVGTVDDDGVVQEQSAGSLPC